MKRRTFLQSTSTAAGAGIMGFPLIKKQKELYRTVLIGSGWWGMNILREAYRSGRVKIAGLCDVDQNQLKIAYHHQTLPHFSTECHCDEFHKHELIHDSCFGFEF